MVMNIKVSVDMQYCIVFSYVPLLAGTLQYKFVELDEFRLTPHSVLQMRTLEELGSNPEPWTSTNAPPP